MIELSSQELEQIDKRGFFVKEFIQFKNLISSFVKIIGIGIITIPIIAVIMMFSANDVTNDNFPFFFFGFFLVIALYILATLGYILLGKIFIGSSGVKAYGMTFKNYNKIPGLKLISWFMGLGKDQIIINILILSPVVIVLGTLLLSAQYDPGEYILMGKAVGILLGVPLLSFVLRQAIEYFHPLYSFGNIGYKIQNLTSIIEDESGKIQRNFDTDQLNFAILHNGFDTLSSTFSQIVTLVIKLEHIEKKANKGNLFDRTKYINSLRSDIVNPLRELKSFLEKQREQLMVSQKELKKVRVHIGSSNNLMQESGLSSKRSEPLLRELTENIEKLDTMIQKMNN